MHPMHSFTYHVSVLKNRPAISSNRELITRKKQYCDEAHVIFVKRHRRGHTKSCRLGV